VRTLGRTLILSGSLLGTATLGACDAPARAEQTRPIRVVRAARPDVAAMKKIIAGHWAGCRSSKDGRLASGPAPLPSDEYLAEFRAEESEDLFDGKWMANYHTSRIIHPDIDRDCAFAVYSSRTAYIEHACRSQIGGITTTIVDLLSGGTPWNYELNEQKRECISHRPGPPDDVSGLPSESAGTARCVWQSKILAPEATGPGSPSGEEKDRAPDSCLYAQMPTYPMGDSRYPVVLKARYLDSSSFAGTQILEFFLAHLGLKEDLVSFSDGEAIPPQRFTRAAMESFLKQSGKTPIGTVR
jgi:hypothetical protein